MNSSKDHDDHDDHEDCSDSLSSENSDDKSMDNHVTNTQVDIEELHGLACRRNESSYIDPITGYTCFTEVAHLRRGKCCGSMCRHCPYGYENVKLENSDGSSYTRPAKCVSGDVAEAHRLLQKWINLDIHTECGNTNEKIHGEAEQSFSEDNMEERKKVGSGRGGRQGGTYTKKNVPYTRSGDEGQSMLLTGHRRKKYDLAFDAMGTVDEACSVLGLSYAELDANNLNRYGNLPEWILQVMSRLMDVGSHLAKPRLRNDSDDKTRQYDGVGGDFDPEHTVNLENWIDMMTEELCELDSFLLPTGGRAAAQLHVSRTVCRRAERLVVELVDQGVCDPEVLRYLNRLSDFCFTAARYSNSLEDRFEIMYKRHFRNEKQRIIIRQKLKKSEENNQHE